MKYLNIIFWLIQYDYSELWFCMSFCKIIFLYLFWKVATAFWGIFCEDRGKHNVAWLFFGVVIVFDECSARTFKKSFLMNRSFNSYESIDSSDMSELSKWNLKSHIFQWLFPVKPPVLEDSANICSQKSMLLYESLGIIT